MKRLFHFLLLATLSIPPIIINIPAWGESDIRTERVQFKGGATSSVIESSITGYESVDYVLNARKGQYMNVSMATNNTSSYFNIIPPGENNVAIFNGSSQGNQYEGILPKSGDYKIRVYMMRNAARRQETANYRLEMIITESGGPMSSGKNSQDALVEGTNYHAKGIISCYIGTEQPTSDCSFGVTRTGNGSATVVVNKPDGKTRIIFFQNGNATGYDMSHSNSGNFHVKKQDDLSIIYIGNERYEIPEVLVFGD